jgi:hypothetical protein
MFPTTAIDIGYTRNIKILSVMNIENIYNNVESQVEIRSAYTALFK